jgi:carbon monoxide dehydrogenase subunit G
MELTNEFDVAVPVEKAWAVLTDIERIAPCLPGAQLREVEGDEYRGAVKIKVGPITTSYDGAIRFTELDELAHRAVMKAEGRETRGQGNVSAVITATMSSIGDVTKVMVTTDLTISGKVAQFGRGVLADVSAKLLDQFVVNLESTVLVPENEVSPDAEVPLKSVKKRKAATKSKASPPVDAGGSEGESATLGDDALIGSADAGNEHPHEGPDGTKTIRQIHSAPAEPLDLVDVAGGSLARRLLKPVAIVAAVAILLRVTRSRRT